MERIPFLAVAVLFAAAALCAGRYPETIAGYSTLSPERKMLVDVRAVGRLLSRLLGGCAAAVLLGALLPLPSLFAATVGGSVAVLLGGALYARRYDLFTQIRRVRRNRERYMPLLLEGDESPELVAGYIATCDLWVYTRRGEAVALCAVKRADDCSVEILNLAVAPAFRRQGLGRRMIACMAHRYRRADRLILGTGETPSTLAFYRACGFLPFRRETGYFTEHYDHPICEEGVVLKDRIWLRKSCL